MAEIQAGNFGSLALSRVLLKSQHISPYFLESLRCSRQGDHQCGLVKQTAQAVIKRLFFASIVEFANI